MCFFYELVKGLFKFDKCDDTQPDLAVEVRTCAN